MLVLRQAADLAKSAAPMRRGSVWLPSTRSRRSPNDTRKRLRSRSRSSPVSTAPFSGRPACCARDGNWPRLATLRDHELRDIGLTRQDLRSATALPLDEDPTRFLAKAVAERRGARWARGGFESKHYSAGPGGAGMRRPDPRAAWT